MAEFSIGVTIQCRTLEEAGVAVEAIKAFRSGKKPVMSMNASSFDETMALSTRIEAALRDAPSNPQKTLILQVLVETSDEDWVPFDNIKKAFTKAELKATQAAAALRDLSWQMREFLPPEDVAGLDTFICVLAERTRSGGSFNYRLTSAGRLAASRYVGH